MPGPDPSHWLHRYTAEEWLRAAEVELQRAEAALAAKQQRSGVAQARRAAGMAWNAVLTAQPDERQGRSYMDHLHALADDEVVPPSVREGARRLLDAPLGQTVVTLGKAGDTSLARAAEIILEHARVRVAPTGTT